MNMHVTRGIWLVPLLLILDAITHGHIFAAANESAPDIITLTISSKNDSGTVSSPPVITVTLTNESSTPIIVIDTNKYLDYPLSCTDVNGSPVPLSAYGKRLATGGPWSFNKRLTKTLNTGDSTVVEIELGRMFSFTETGQYLISTKRIFFRDRTGVKASVVSNTYRFSLTN